MLARIVRTLPVYGERTIKIQWEVVDAPYGDIQVDVFRSGSPSGPWQKIVTVQNSFYYYDIIPEQYGWENFDFFYKIIAKCGVETAESSPVFYDTYITEDYVEQEEIPPNMRWVYKDPYRRQPRLLRHKLIKEFDILAKKIRGIPYIILKRKHWGARCPECFDEISNTKLKSMCERCYETSRDGGYWDPIYTWGIEHNAAKPAQSVPDISGKMDVKRANISIPFFPRVSALDILVKRQTNERFIVNSVYNTTIRGMPIHQTVVCSLINNDAIEYKIPLELDFRGK